MRIKLYGLSRLSKEWVYLCVELEQHTLLPVLAKAIMPYGKYKGQRVIDLPEPYLVWYRQKGFPKSKLGDQLALTLEIKTNGLEYLLKPYR